MTDIRVVLTIIRHGESTDNLRSAWAGWADAVLTNHGMNQARALASSLANTPFRVVYSSTLRRALMTATAILDGQPIPRPPLITTPLLRERHFGIAEGKPWHTIEPGMAAEDFYSQGLFPVLHGRTKRFPGGESQDDVYRRAEQFIREVLWPRIQQAIEEKISEMDIAIVSHGMFINEFIAALFRLDIQQSASPVFHGGLRNTAWTRLHMDASNVNGLDTERSPPCIHIQVTDVNRHDHLSRLTRQKGGLGNAAFDPKQKDIRSFFGGATSDESNKL